MYCYCTKEWKTDVKEGRSKEAFRYQLLQPIMEGIAESKIISWTGHSWLQS